MDENSDKQDVEQISIDDASPLMAFSPKAIQAFYNAVTGKTEAITRYYHRLYQIQLPDFEQLKTKLDQALEQYQVLAQTEQITIIHADDTKEKFSSFERFKIYNSSDSTPTEAVTFKFNFLIQQPGLKQTQNYVAYIRVASNIVYYEKVRKDLPPEVWDMISFQNAFVSVEYVDYMIARNFLGVIDDWFSGLHEIEESPAFCFAKRHSKWIPTLIRYPLLYLVTAVFAYLISNSEINPSHSQQLIFAIVGGVFGFTVFRLATALGSEMRNSVKCYTHLSYIHINRGDKKKIATAETANKKRVTKAIGAIIMSFIVGILSSVIASWIFLILSNN